MYIILYDAAQVMAALPYTQGDSLAFDGSFLVDTPEKGIAMLEKQGIDCTILHNLIAPPEVPEIEY